MTEPSATCARAGCSNPGIYSSAAGQGIPRHFCAEHLWEKTPVTDSGHTCDMLGANPPSTDRCGRPAVVKWTNATDGRALYWCERCRRKHYPTETEKAQDERKALKSPMTRIPGLIWENWIRPLVLYAALWAGFRYWLDFENKQSIVFAFLFGSCYFGFKELRKKTERAEDFIPYHVSITLRNAHDLLFKYNFLKTEEEWKQLCETSKDTSVLRRGLNFTVLSLGKNGLPHLTWWDDHKIFRAGLPSFEEVLEGLKLPNESPVRWEWSPRLYFGFRHGTRHGYAIALCVRDKWWEKNKPEIKGIEIEKEPHEDSVYLMLGTLPYGEIGLDYAARRQDRKTELTKLGWTIKDFHEPEVPTLDRIEVQNEICSVSQQFCEMD
jgi:hypothetical protein